MYDLQKQPFVGVLIKRCSENMQQIYRRGPMPNTSATHRHGCSINLLYIFRIPFLKNTSRGLLLDLFIYTRDLRVTFYVWSLFSLSYLAPDGAPRNLTAVSNSSTSVYLTWLPPLESLQNGNIKEYKIRYSGRDDNGSELLTNETCYLLKGLGKYTLYSISLEARTEVGFGPLKYISVTTLEDGIKLYIFFLLFPFIFSSF